MISIFFTDVKNMNKYQEIRNVFSQYFVKNEHEKINSSSLIPEEDKSLMFVNSGMVQFKNSFLGLGKQKAANATTIQKSLRAGGKHNDLDNVGYTRRHHTFFEMLGNFSFGGYFKEEAINYAWNFLTKEINLNKEKLYVTVYHTDDEAFNIWKKVSGFSDEKIIRISTSDNFWQMGDTGPCGPCSEIYYDYGESVKGGLPGSVDQDGDRFCEIWNLVFMQHEKFANGEMKNLSQKCIDTGMGLERLVSVIEGKTDNYETSLFKELINNSRNIFNDLSEKHDVNHRVIADHLRAMSFLIADGITPSNEGRGYVLRRIMRRGMRYAHEICEKDAKFHTLFDKLNDLMGSEYQELKSSSELIKSTIEQEEISFKENLGRGIEIAKKEIDWMYGKGYDMITGKEKNSILTWMDNFEHLGKVNIENHAWNISSPSQRMKIKIQEKKRIEQTELQKEEELKRKNDQLQQPEILKIIQQEIFQTGKLKFSGKTAFKLYDTYGFPIDMTEDIMRRSGGLVDMDEFNLEMSEQKNRSKANWKGADDFSASVIFKEIASKKSQILDFSLTEIENAKIISIVKEKDEKNEASGEFWALFDKSCFYPEGGGQEGDMGVILSNGIEVANVIDVQKKDGLAWCLVNSEKTLNIGEVLSIKVDLIRRDKLKSGHTATHILQSVLKKYINKDIKQMGSKISEDGFRFDFNNQKPLSESDIKTIEKKINKIIRLGIDVKINNSVTKESAINQGAVANFGDKYGDFVRTVKINDFSLELCGGMHVSNTSQIKGFSILKTFGVSSGICRIEAVFGDVDEKVIINDIKKTIDCKSDEIIGKIEEMKEKIRQLETLNQKLEIENLSSRKYEIMSTKCLTFNFVEYINQGVKFVKDICFNIGGKIPENQVLIVVFSQDSSKTIGVFSKNSKFSAKDLIHKITEKFDKKSGGGTEKFAMSGVKSNATKDEILNFLSQVLNENEAI